MAGVAQESALRRHFPGLRRLQLPAASAFSPARHQASANHVQVCRLSRIHGRLGVGHVVAHYRLSGIRDGSGSVGLILATRQTRMDSWSFASDHCLRSNRMTPARLLPVALTYASSTVNSSFSTSTRSSVTAMSGGQLLLPFETVSQPANGDIQPRGTLGPVSDSRNSRLRCF